MKNLRKIMIMVLFFVLSLVPVTVKGSTWEGYFDELLKNNNITIYSDIDYDENTFFNFVMNNISNYTWWNSDNYSVHYGMQITDCDFTKMSCKININKYDGVNVSENVKSYGEIKINIDKDVSKYFSFVKDDKIYINYDETMFENESEKNQYIINFLNSFNKENATMYYNEYDKSLVYSETSSRLNKKIVKKKITDIVFEYVEQEYSDNFKKILDNNVLKIKSDTEINSDILMTYFSYLHNTGKYRFDADGKIKNGKVFIKLSEYENQRFVEKEKHLVNVVKDNIDINIFNKKGLGDNFKIFAEEPINKKSYIDNYLSLVSNYEEFEDKSYSNIFPVSVYGSSDKNYLMYIKRNKKEQVVDIQYHELNASFVGYNDNLSEDYKNMIGNEITINADELNDETIRYAISFPLIFLGCSSDYSYCDIGYYNKDKVEIHKIKINLNSTYSENFMKAFNVKNDKTIDILLDKNMNFNYFFNSFYDKETNNYYHYNCNNGICNLTLSNYFDNYREEHVVSYNAIETTPTKYYLENVNSVVEFYPGQNKNAYNMLNYNNKFNKTNSDIIIITNNCDKETNKCDTAIRNEEGNIEIHKSDILMKEGKSPEYLSYFMDDKIKLNSIYVDNQEYLSMISSAYLMSLTKTFSYLTNYQNNDAILHFNYFEEQPIKVEFEKENSKQKEIVDKYLKKIDNSDLSFKIEDLEFINSFYYNTTDNNLSVNYNTVELSNTIKNIVDDKHINYYYELNSGAGDELYEDVSGNIILYYDGIAYGMTENKIRTIKNHVIYIPDETPESVNEYILAAQKRVDEYLGKNSGVVIEFSRATNKGNVQYLDLDFSKFDNNIYKIKMGNREESVIIIKDSNKMKKPSFYATDVINNIIVSSKNANYPLNTIVSSKIENKMDNISKEVIEKLKLNIAQVVDIDLYSSSVGYINKFNGSLFNVSVPLSNTKLNTDNLFAYYISENGEVEEYSVTVEDGNAQFQTKHFSKYIITNKLSESEIKQLANEINNPQTGDKVLNYIIISIVSLGLFILSFILPKKKTLK